MPRPIRMAVPDRLYFVTNRTFQARFLMTPSPRVNSLIGGVVARALERFDVRLHAFVFMSNHFHLIASSPLGNISDFVGYLESNVAKELGRHIGWKGSFWDRRFSAEPILDEDALVRRFAYVFSHGVKEGLVDRARDWPGLTCFPEILHDQRRLFPWYDRTAQYWARVRGKPHHDDLFVSRRAIVLTPPPLWVTLSCDERQARMQEVLAQAESEAVETRDEKLSIGPHAVMAQDPLQAPAVAKRSPRPLCHASTRAAYRAFRSSYRDFLAAYREASALFRAGHANVEFPAYTYRPPLPVGWSLAHVARCA